MLSQIRITPQWLAGFFDGEGCFCITTSGRYKRCVQLRLILVNTDIELLQLIQHQYGGHLVRREHKRFPAWKPSACLTWQNEHAAILIRQIGRFLVLKRRQLELAKEFLVLRVTPDRYKTSFEDGAPKRRLTEAVMEQQLDIKSRLQVINKKGRAA